MSEEQLTNPHDPALPYFPCEQIPIDEMANQPVVLVYEVELPCTPAQLFAVFDDEHSWPQWVHGIGGVEWTSPRPFGVGTTRTVRFWGGMEVYEVFHGWTDDEHMAFTFTGTSQEVWESFGEDYRVTDLGDGRCKLRWQVSYTPTGVFATIHPLVGWSLKLNLGTYMWRLKRYCKRHYG